MDTTLQQPIKRTRRKAKRRRQKGDGSIVERHNAFHLRYWSVDAQGKPGQRSVKLCDKDNAHFSTTCQPVRDLAAQKMSELRQLRELDDQAQDMRVADFWTGTYLPFITEHKKLSTVSGYKQIWNQHLKEHFGDQTLREYRKHVGSRFLLSLTKTQGRRTLNHIRSLASGIFSHAANLGVIEYNPWHGMKILGKVTEPTGTPHYTLEEAENIISALVEHVDCQLVMALSCFLGLRPGEISGLKWEDFDQNCVHIRRAVVRGVVGTTKTPESVASLPLIDHVRVPLELWRQKCGRPSHRWLFQTKSGRPQSLRDLVRNKIVPTLTAKNIRWKSLYAGRRGAGTAVIDLTNGNYAAAQELLRHKHMSTTLQFYKKQTETSLQRGIDAIANALEHKALKAGKGQ